MKDEKKVLSEIAEQLEQFSRPAAEFGKLREQLGISEQLQATIDGTLNSSTARLIEKMSLPLPFDDRLSKHVAEISASTNRLREAAEKATRGLTDMMRHDKLDAFMNAPIREVDFSSIEIPLAPEPKEGDAEKLVKWAQEKLNRQEAEVSGNPNASVYIIATQTNNDEVAVETMTVLGDSIIEITGFSLLTQEERTFAAGVQSIVLDTKVLYLDPKPPQLTVV